jgi:uncharacterized membrane protein (UPF0182 family)
MAENSGQDTGLPTDFEGQQVPPQLGPIIKFGAVIVALVLLFVGLSFLKSVYTDLLWFDALDFRGVYTKILLTRIVLFVIGAVVVVVPLSVSVYFAHRLSTGPVTVPLPPETVEILRKLVVWGAVAAVVVLSVVFGGILGSRWEIFLRSINSVSFEQLDPVYGKDLSFYVFTLPVYEFLQGWLLGATVVILIASLALYFVNYSLRGVSFPLTTGLKVHVSIIGAVLMFMLAAGHWLDRWELVLSDQGAVFGAAYVDLHARKPALLILTIIASASGVLILINAYLRGLRLLVGGVALWVAMAILLSAAWPAAMQQFTVNPNEFVKEGQYIARNIEFTRSGFGIEIDDVEEVFYPAEAILTKELIDQNPQTINNIRLWDHRPLSDVYKQIQLIRPYYDFKEADVDRYTVNGEYRQVLLSAREVAPEKLELESQTWVNQRLIYTHGIGLAMSPATQFTPEGRPEFYAKDIPSDGRIPVGLDSPGVEPDIVVDNPRIYYGENTVEYVIANTNTEELDYQTPEGELVRWNYDGAGGVELGSFIRKAAYAWEFADINILISGEIKSDSLLLYNREIQERISTVAPFLVLDNDPYIVAAEDNLFWMQDAYTISDRYPYSDPIDATFNYMRNSVKITVDAYNGTIRFYIWDTSDPLIQTYAGMFPDLFVSKELMPASLIEHVRYPQDLFAIQAQKFTKYHMRDSQNFYNNEDLWAFANEKFGQSETLQVVEPYYVIMKLPGEDKEEFVQLIPYTPNQRQNLVGWLAARSDGDNYGKLVAFNFPKDRQIDGPEQVEARIDNDRDISPLLTLLCTEGSTCIRGNLLVIPVGSSILYVEPVYIQAEGIRFPELKKVILATGDRVVMEDSLQAALASLTAVRGVAGTQTPSSGEPGAPPAIPRGPTSVGAEIGNLGDALEGVKENLATLEEALQRLIELAGGE